MGKLEDEKFRARHKLLGGMVSAACASALMGLGEYIEVRPPFSGS